MRPAFGILITLSFLTIAGCATPAGEYGKAEEINSIDSYKAYIEKYPYSPYAKKAKNKIAELEESERRKYQIKKYWGNLKKGMSVDEVDHLIGPLNRGAVRSIRNMSASTSTRNTSKTGNEFPYHGHYFTLIFDAAGKLSSWSLKQIK